MEQNRAYLKSFLPYTLAAFLIGIVGGFATVLGPASVQDIGNAYNTTGLNLSKLCPLPPVCPFWANWAM